MNSFALRACAAVSCLAVSVPLTVAVAEPRHGDARANVGAGRQGAPHGYATRSYASRGGNHGNAWQRGGWGGHHDPYLAVSSGRGAWNWNSAWGGGWGDGFGGYGSGFGWGWNNGWAWGGVAVGLGVGVILAPPVFILPPPIYFAPPPLILSLPAIAPIALAAPITTAPRLVSLPAATADLVGAAVPPPIMVSPPPYIVAAAAPPPIIFAPPAFGFAIAPPLLAFAPIGPMFWNSGFITGGYIADAYYGGFWGLGFGFGGGWGWQGGGYGWGGGGYAWRGGGYGRGRYGGDFQDGYHGHSTSYGAFAHHGYDDAHTTYRGHESAPHGGGGHEGGRHESGGHDHHH